MGNAITQESRVIWQELRRHGGWWSVKQITHHWRPTFAEFEVEEIVDALVKGGFLMRREQGPGLLCVAFTSECNQLPGTEIEEGSQHV